MKFGLLYEIEVPRPWTETSVSDGFWEALEQLKVAEEVGFSSALELEGFGIEPSLTRAQWHEALHMIPRMWTQEEFSWDSPTFKMPQRNVLPKPVQKPHPPIWMSGTQPESAILAGERHHALPPA